MTEKRIKEINDFVNNLTEQGLKCLLEKVSKRLRDTYRKDLTYILSKVDTTVKDTTIRLIACPKCDGAVKHCKENNIISPNIDWFECENQECKYNFPVYISGNVGDFHII